MNVHPSDLDWGSKDMEEFLKCFDAGGHYMNKWDQMKYILSRRIYNEENLPSKVLVWLWGWEQAKEDILIEERASFSKLETIMAM